MLPADMEKLSYGATITPFGTNIIMSSQPPGDSQFAIGLYDVPTNICAKLITRVAPSFISIMTQGVIKVVKDSDTGKLDVDAIASNCNAPANIFFLSR